MKLKTTKRCLNLALAITLATPATFAHAASSTPVTSNDPVVLLLEAMKSDSPQRAKELLAKAKIQIQSEKLPEESVRKLDALLSTAEQAIENRGPQKSKSDRMASVGSPIGFQFDANGNVVAKSPSTPVTPTPTPTPAPAPTTSTETDELQKLLMENPALRDSMREIGRGRVTRDANQLQTTMPGQIAERNKKDIDFAIALDTPDAWISAIRATGLLIKNAPELNQALREEYDLSTDELADHIIGEYTKGAAAAGLFRQAVSLAKNKGLYAWRTGTGIGVEAAATYILNINLALRLLDLYGLKMSESNQNVLILSIYTLMKLGIQGGAKTAPVQGAISATGSVFGKALATRDPKLLLEFAKTFFSNKTVIAAMAATPDENVAGQAVVANTVATEVTEAAEAVAATPKRFARTLGVLKWAGRKTVIPIKLAFSVGFSVAEMRMFGYMAKKTLKVAQTTRRSYLNKSLSNYLMTTEGGEGFTKLLVLALNVGPRVPNVVDPLKSKDAGVKFILNLARSQKVCSPTEQLRYKALVKAGRDTAFARAKSYASFSSDEYPLLKFACDTNLNQDRFERMIKEFSTFNAIPQSLITELRFASYSNRLAMGEVVMQLMYLDGDLDPNEELPFFKQTVAKILGLDIVEGLGYFTRLNGFIRTNGGMVTNINSPTGYGIKASRTENPYDMAVGYTTSGGPDAPVRTSSAAGALGTK